MSEKHRLNLQDYWAGALFLVGVYYVNIYFVKNSFFGSYTYLVSIAFYIFIVFGISNIITSRLEKIKEERRNKQSSNSYYFIKSFLNLLVVSLLLHIGETILITYIVLVGLIPNKKNIAIENKAYYIFILTITAIYIPLQIWFSSAIINTVGSDEDLLSNNSIKYVSLIFSSLGFGLLLAKLADEKISAFILALTIGFVSMYFGQEQLLNYWASKQPTENKISAFIGILGKSAIINHTGAPEEKDIFKTPEKIRAELVYAPAAVALTGKDTIYRNIVNNSNYIRSFLLEPIKKNNPKKAQALADIKKLWVGYVDYLKLAAMTEKDKIGAANLIFYKSRQHKDYFNIVPIAEYKEYGDDLTCTGVARKTREEIQKEIPKRYSASTVFNSKKGRKLVLDGLSKRGLHLKHNWRFTNEKALIKDLSVAVCNKRDKLIKDFENKYNVSFLKKESGFISKGKGAPYTVEEFMKIVANIPNIKKYSDLEKFVIKEESRIIANTSTSSFIKSIESKVNELGNDWIKAAVLPAVGLSASFTFMLLNVVILIGGLLTLVKSPNILKSSAIILFVVSLIWIAKPYEQGYLQAGITLQEKVYRHSNYWFTRIGLPPTLSDQTDSYKQKMSNHHLRKANNALQNNLITTPPSRSALFHVSMANYYNKDAKTEKIIASMLKRYKSLGAENSESSLNERYKYIKKWQNVYL